MRIWMSEGHTLADDDADANYSIYLNNVYFKTVNS